MKKISTVFIILVFAQLCIAQEFSLNQGGTTQNNYFTVISYENVKGKIILSAKINNKAYRFILDTGAPNTITQSLYNEIKPIILTEIPVGDQSGKVDSMLVVSIESVTLGGITFRDIPTLVSDEHFIANCFQVDGLIGSNMLRNSIVQFSSTNNTITLTDDKNKLPLNKRQSSKLFLTPHQSSPYVWVNLRDNKRANIQLLFDSGDDDFFSLSIVHFAFFQEKNVFSDYSQGYGSYTFGLHGLAKDTIVYRVGAAEMKINGSRFRNVSFETTSNVNSRVGSELLKYGIVTVDYKDKRFYFEPFKKDANLQAKQFPFAPTFINDTFSIGIVWGDQYKNQLSVGDHIIEIDGENYENADFCDIVNASNLMENDKISLKLKDKTGAMKTIVLEKE